MYLHKFLTSRDILLLRQLDEVDSEIIFSRLMDFERMRYRFHGEHLKECVFRCNARATFLVYTKSTIRSFK
jgi:hypothetical protein